MTSPERPAPGRLAADRLVLAVGAVVLVLAAVSNTDADATRSLDALAVGLLALGAVAVLAGGRYPAIVAVCALALTFLWYGLGYGSGLVNVVALAAFYRLGRSDRQRATLVVVSLSVAATVVVMVGLSDETWWAALTAAGYVVMATLFGELIRSRHLLVEQYAAEAERAQRDAERRIAEERLQIARDVHDVLAHTVASMTVQAGVAADALDRDPPAARDALANIRTAGRDAMQEMRATVSVLRSGGEPVETAPAPRLDRLGELVERTRAQGVDVSLAVALSDQEVPELIELTAYRVVQESLTNVVRHAGASAASVEVREEGATLCVEVCDDGHGAAAPPGFGLRGMSERVESVGGELWHGRRDGGGWTVRARLPLRVPA